MSATLVATYLLLLLLAGAEGNVNTFSEGIINELLATEKGRLPCGSLVYTTSHQQLLPLLRDGKGTIVEMGVFAARTTNLIAERYPHHVVHGFDSFQGLPESWDQGDIKNPAGTFHISILNTTRSGKTYLKGDLPKIRSNVKLHIGWFNDTLPPFAKEIKEPIGLLHIDSDLYSSANMTLIELSEFLVPETVIVFDEFFGYPKYQDHEVKAFYEFIKSREDLSFELIGTQGFWRRGICTTLRPTRTYPDHCQGLSLRLVSSKSNDHIKLNNEGLVTSKSVPLVSGFCNGHSRESYAHEHHVETVDRITRIEDEVKKLKPSAGNQPQSQSQPQQESTEMTTRIKDLQDAVDQVHKRLKQHQERENKQMRLAGLSAEQAPNPNVQQTSFPSFDHFLGGFVLAAIGYGVFVFGGKLIRTNYSSLKAAMTA